MHRYICHPAFNAFAFLSLINPLWFKLSAVWLQKAQLHQIPWSTESNSSSRSFCSHPRAPVLFLSCFWNCFFFIFYKVLVESELVSALAFGLFSFNILSLRRKPNAHSQLCGWIMAFFLFCLLLPKLPCHVRYLWAMNQRTVTSINTDLLSKVSSGE